MVYNTFLNRFINYSSLLQISSCWCTHSLQSRAAAWSASQTGTTPARGEGGSPSATGSNKKFISTVWTEMIHTTLLPSFLTSHFSKGWGSLGRYATQKSLVMRRSGYQPQKGQFVGLNPPRDTERTKFLTSHSKISQTHLEFCSLKRYLDLVSKLKSQPKPNRDLALISPGATYLGSQMGVSRLEIAKRIPTYIFIFIPKKLVRKPIQNTTFSSLIFKNFISS